jgi:thiol-disulfide isomerase/thioredoxin
MINLVVISFSGCTNNSNVNDSGEKFSFILLNGESTNITEYRGKVVIIDLFGVACTWCVPQVYVLEEIRNTYSKNDLEIITIDVWGDTSESIQDLIEAYRCKSPCYMEDQFSNLYVYVQGYVLSFRQAKEFFGKENGLELDWIFGLDNKEGTVVNTYTEGGAVPRLHILDENGNIYYSFNGYTEYSAITDKLDEII